MSTKKRLALLPEILPRPVARQGPEPVRGRTLARLQVLAALTTATMTTACPYVVVDPLPAPGCAPVLPTVRAVYLPSPDPGAADSGTIELPVRRLVEVTVSWSDPTFTFGDARVEEADGRITIVEQSATPTAGRIVVRAPEGKYELTIAVRCAEPGGGSYTLHLELTTAGVTATISAGAS